MIIGNFTYDKARVAVTHAAPGRMTSREQLQQLGLVAAPDIVPGRGRVPLRGSGGRSWPDYHDYLAGAPRNSAGDGPDRSRADFMWCKWAIERGWSVDEVAAQLMEISTKAQEKNHGEAYAGKTAQRATAAAAREPQHVVGELLPRRSPRSRRVPSNAR